MNKHINTIILSFTVPNIKAYQYDDHIETESGEKFKKLKELIKIYTKREKKYIEEHINFINFSLKEFSNVLHKDIIETLKKNDDDYGRTLHDLLEINLSF